MRALSKPSPETDIETPAHGGDDAGAGVFVSTEGEVVVIGEVVYAAFDMEAF